MKSGHFVEKLSNVARFLDLTRTIDARGAREAGWGLVKGEAGFGKTNTLTWYAMKKRAAFVRAKAGWTPHWALTDIADVLGVSHAQSTEKLFNAIMPELMARAARDGLILMVDEADHAARDVRVLETLRDLTDAAEMPMIIGGMKDIERTLRRYSQVASRIADVCTFGPATAADVEAICRELAVVEIADDLAAEIQHRTGGRLREVKNAIARVEAKMKASRGGAITLARWIDAGNPPLTNDDRRGSFAPRLVEAG